VDQNPPSIESVALASSTLKLNFEWMETNLMETNLPLLKYTSEDPPVVYNKRLILNILTPDVFVGFEIFLRKTVSFQILVFNIEARQCIA